LLLLYNQLVSMKNKLVFILVIFFFVCSYGQEKIPLEKRIISTIDSTNSKELVLIQEFNINVSIDSVWNAYTTKRGWESWAVALAEINLKNGGLIRTNYNKNGKIGDSTTIVLHVKNYVPKKLITLQAELTKNFPEFMKADEKDLYNIVYFESIDPKITKVTSYGIGYKNNAKYKSLMQFFIKGNAMSYVNLISYLETGKPSVNY